MWESYALLLHDPQSAQSRFEGDVYLRCVTEQNESALCKQAPTFMCIFLTQK